MKPVDFRPEGPDLGLHLAHGQLDAAGGLKLAEMLQHHRPGQDGRNRIGDA